MSIPAWTGREDVSDSFAGGESDALPVDRLAQGLAVTGVEWDDPRACMGCFFPMHWGGDRESALPQVGSWGTPVSVGAKSVAHSDLERSSFVITSACYGGRHHTNLFTSAKGEDW